MDITVYLPDELGARAKRAELKLSRLLRDAVERELDRRDAMGRLLDDGDPEVYEVTIHSQEGTQGGLLLTGRITGRRVAGDDELGVYLTSDRRVIVHDAAMATYQRIDDPPSEMVSKLMGWLQSRYGGAIPEDWDEILFQACDALGVQPMIDL
jgi:hypothetical protein